MNVRNWRGFVVNRRSEDELCQRPKFIVGYSAEGFAVDRMEWRRVLSKAKVQSSFWVVARKVRDCGL